MAESRPLSVRRSPRQSIGAERAELRTYAIKDASALVRSPLSTNHPALPQPAIGNIMSQPELTETRDGPLVTLTMNRPDALNALTDALIEELSDTFARLDRDSDVGAIILTGAGRAFCSGGDVKGMANRRERTYEERLVDLRAKQRPPLLMRQSSKVIIAAVNGAAMGAGFCLALAADFRIVGRSAKFGTAFANIGFSGDFGISWLLTQLVGPAKARELLILNPRLSAQDAADLGLVTRLVDDDQVMSEAHALAMNIARGPHLAWGYMKKNLLVAESEPLAAVLESEALSQSRCAMTDDHKEARAAFIEKRKPVFRGR